MIELGTAQGNEPSETTTAAPESVATTPEVSSPEVPLGQEGVNPDPVAAKPVYQPNLKFKTFEKELEFEPWLKDSIKDAETEKKARALHEKAYGLDYVKQNREQLKTEVSELKTWKTETEKNLNQAVGFAHTDNIDDMDQFFKSFRIPLDKVLKYAVRLAERTPDQQEFIDKRFSVQQNQQTAEQRLEEASRREQEADLKIKTFELNQHLSKPEVASVAEAFDARVSQPGAFYAEVVRRGQLYAAQGQDISVEQAVTEVMRLIGPMSSPAMTGGVDQGLAPQSATSPKVVTQSQKPTIPNISGRGASVVKRKPKSFEDLRKMGEQYAASEG